MGIIRDRLTDLLGSSSPNPTRNLLKSSEEDDFLKSLTTDVEELEGHWLEIDQHIEKMNKLYAETSFFINNEQQTKMKCLIEESDKHIQLLTEKVTRFKNDNSACTEEYQIRIHEIVINYLTHKYDDVVSRHSTFLEMYYSKHKSLIRHQAKLTNTSVTDDEIDTFIENGNASFFTDNIFDDTRTVQLQLNDLYHRRDDLLKIEESIVKVRDCFNKLAHLISEQQDKIDRIEHFAEKATRKIIKGNKALQKSVKKRKSYLKQKIKLTTLGGVIAVTLITVLMI